MTGLYMRGTTGRKKQYTSISILHGGKMLLKALDALAIRKHTLELNTFQTVLLIGTAKVLGDRNGLPDNGVIATGRMLEVIDLMATLA